MGMEPIVEPEGADELFEVAINLLCWPHEKDLRPAFEAISKLLVIQGAMPTFFPPDARMRLQVTREGADDRPHVVCEDLRELREECHELWGIGG